MKRMKVASTVMLWLAPVLLLACATAKSHYEDARNVNTIPAYQEFLKQYPSGEYATLAQTRIETLNFEKAQAVNTVAAYEGFMHASNSDLFKTYAIERIQKIYDEEYLKAKTADTIEAYTHYVEAYPNSPYLKNCTDRIEDLEWIKALKRGDAVGYYHYLNNCSACGKHSAEAQRRFTSALRSGVVVELSSVKGKVEQMLSRSDIVVVQFESNQISTHTGTVRLESLSAADEVTVRIRKGDKAISASDFVTGNIPSTLALILKDREPASGGNPIGFATIIFYATENGLTDYVFVEGGKAYLFRQSDS